MSTKYHINPKSMIARKCSAKTIEGCKYYVVGEPEPPHFSTEEEANDFLQKKFTNTYNTISTIEKDNKNNSHRKSNRIYQQYKTSRDTSRHNLDNTEDYEGGSHFNRIVRNIAKNNKMPIDDVKKAIYQGYADKHSLSIEEATTHFDDLKKNRELEHEFHNYYQQLKKDNDLYETFTNDYKKNNPDWINNKHKMMQNVREKIAENYQTERDNFFKNN